MSPDEVIVATPPSYDGLLIEGVIWLYCWSIFTHLCTQFYSFVYSFYSFVYSFLLIFLYY